MWSTAFKTMILDYNIIKRYACLHWIWLPSKYMYCRREVVKVILVETLGEIKGEYVFKVA